MANNWYFYEHCTKVFFSVFASIPVVLLGPFPDNHSNKTMKVSIDTAEHTKTWYKFNCIFSYLWF